MKITMKLNSEPFEMIKNGKKIYELRLLDDKRRTVKVGDRVQFVNASTGESLSVKVVEILRFSSFIDLYEALSPLEIGYIDKNADKASPSDMLRYYSKEEQERYGVVAFKIERV